MTRKWENVFGLLASIALVAVVDMLGRYYGPNDWYEGLAKPGLVLPPGVSSYVWVPLYLLNAVCVWLVWLDRNTKKDVFGAVVFYLVQLILIMQWSNVFFGMHRMDFALYIIIAFSLFAVLTTFMFWRVRPPVAALYLPYPLFSFYMVWLNWQFLALNP